MDSNLIKVLFLAPARGGALTQGFTTQILPFNLGKFQEISRRLEKGYKSRSAGKLSAMGVEKDIIDMLNRRRPKKPYKISNRIGEGLVEAAIALEEGENRTDWQWTSDELLYEQFLIYLEKRDPAAFELANLLAPIYENKGPLPFRMPFRARGFQGYLSREEARRLLLVLGSQDLEERFTNMEAHLPQHPELIHRVECYKRLRELLRELVQKGHDALFWVDLDREARTNMMEDAAEDATLGEVPITSSSPLMPPLRSG